MSGEKKRKKRYIVLAIVLIILCVGGYFGYTYLSQNMDMFSKEIIVRCESGLHNKQATYFVQKANEFESSIWLESSNRKMNAKSLLGIMSLGIVPGATVVITADGHDEQAAVDALEVLLQRDVF